MTYTINYESVEVRTSSGRDWSTEELIEAWGAKTDHAPTQLHTANTLSEARVIFAKEKATLLAPQEYGVSVGTVVNYEVLYIEDSDGNITDIYAEPLTHEEE